MQKCLNYGPGSPLEVKIKNNLAILVFFKELKNIIRSLKGDITPKQKSPKMSRNPH